MRAGPALDAVVHKYIKGALPGPPYPHYSTSLTWAWNLIEALDELGFPVSINRHPEGWEVIFWQDDSDEARGEAKGFALAVCMAALGVPLTT